MKMNMTEEELLALAEDRPVPKEPFESAICYGMGKWLKRYAGYPETLPLCVETDHGPSLHDKPTSTEVKSAAPIMLFHGARLAAVWKNMTNRPCAVMGSPFVYYRKMNGIEIKKEAKGTVAFPAHTTPLIESRVDWKKYCEELKQLPKMYQPVTVCLYWLDILKGYHRIYMDAGFPVVTAGHIYDEKFTERFYEILSNHRYATSNLIHSSTLYAVEMGLPFFLYGQQVSYYNYGDPNVPKELYSPSQMHQTYNKANQLFSKLSNEITQEQKDFVEAELGIHTALSKRQIRLLLWKAFIYYYLKNIPKSAIRRALRIMKLTYRMGMCVVHYGIIDMIFAPSSALSFWRKVANAIKEATLHEHAVMNSALKLKIPSASPEELFPGISQLPVTLSDYTYTYGDMPVHEILTLCQIVRWAKPECIFEIGTFEGGTTMQMAANSSAKIYTLDLPPETEEEKRRVLDADLDVYPEVPGAEFRETDSAQQIHQLFGDSQTFDFSPYHGRMDLVFVDACHHYEFVKTDSENALKMVSPDGIILWHDYADYAPGVVYALNELSTKKQLFHLQGTSLVIHSNIIQKGNRKNEN